MTPRRSARLAARATTNSSTSTSSTSTSHPSTSSFYPQFYFDSTAPWNTTTTATAIPSKRTLSASTLKYYQDPFPSARKHPRTGKGKGKGKGKARAQDDDETEGLDDGRTKINYFHALPVETLLSILSYILHPLKEWNLAPPDPARCTLRLVCRHFNSIILTAVRSLEVSLNAELDLKHYLPKPKPPTRKRGNRSATSSNGDQRDQLLDLDPVLPLRPVARLQRTRCPPNIVSLSIDVDSSTRPRGEIEEKLGCAVAIDEWMRRELPNLSALKRFKATYARDLSYTGLQLLPRDLDELFVVGCKSVTPLAHTLTWRRLTNLKSLSFSSMDLFTDPSVPIALEEYLPHLVDLRIIIPCPDIQLRAAGNFCMACGNFHDQGRMISSFRRGMGLWTPKLPDRLQNLVIEMDKVEFLQRDLHDWDVGRRADAIRADHKLGFQKNDDSSNVPNWSPPSHLQHMDVSSLTITPNTLTLPSTLTSLCLSYPNLPNSLCFPTGLQKLFVRGFPYHCEEDEWYCRRSASKYISDIVECCKDVKHLKDVTFIVGGFFNLCVLNEVGFDDYGPAASSSTPPANGLTFEMWKERLTLSKFAQFAGHSLEVLDLWDGALCLCEFNEDDDDDDSSFDDDDDSDDIWPDALDFFFGIHLFAEASNSAYGGSDFGNGNADNGVGASSSSASTSTAAPQLLSSPTSADPPAIQPTPPSTSVSCAQRVTYDFFASLKNLRVLTLRPDRNCCRRRFISTAVRAILSNPHSKLQVLKLEELSDLGENPNLKNQSGFHSCKGATATRRSDLGIEKNLWKLLAERGVRVERVPTRSVNCGISCVGLADGITRFL